MTQIAETQATTTDFVRTVLILPAEERRREMTDRLREFALMDPLQRAASMREVMAEVARLSSEDRKLFFRTRDQAFLELPIGTRMALGGTRVEVLGGVPRELLREEVEVLESLATGLGEEKGVVLRQMLTQTQVHLSSHPNRSPGETPPVARKRWWRVWRH